jgi:polyhydroxyalkanoate synthesis regulator protein
MSLESAVNDETETRVIMKYPNRHLQDTEKSQYITLQKIRDLVLAETPKKGASPRTNGHSRPLTRE